VLEAKTLVVFLHHVGDKSGFESPIKDGKLLQQVAPLWLYVAITVDVDEIGLANFDARRHVCQILKSVVKHVVV